MDGLEQDAPATMFAREQGGLFPGPTHAIQVGSPLENVLALYRTAGSLCEMIDDAIHADAGNTAETRGINLSKLF